MKIDHVWHFAGAASLPAAFRGTGPHTLTMEQLVQLAEHHAILLYKTAEGETVLAFDSHQGRFKQR
ncbi:MAG TPA: hypothetical protein VLE97_06570 [Gaiellaceae bacterium]|nr:hypothetical protein [Gaiellaceae bacterium]